LGGVHLIDAASKKKYFVVTDSDGTVLTSNNIPNIAPKSQITVWAKFPAPPDDVQKITFEIPHFITVEDVPIIRYARERIEMRATVLSLAMLLQQSPGRISTLQTKVIDLVFRVQDMGGKVQDLNAKETTTEVRIELAADVLFDFDEAETLPKDGGATVGGPLHLVLIFGDRQSGSGGLALTGPAGDMEWLYDNLVLHAVGEWQPFHLVRIVAGYARSGSDEDRPRRSGSDQRARSAGQLGDAFPCRFDEIADGHIVLGRIVPRYRCVVCTNACPRSN
jgi:hypothetical protein